MDELHRSSDKLAREARHLCDVLGQDEPNDQQVLLALTVAKRVRRESNIVVRLLAAARDQTLQS